MPYIGAIRKEIDAFPGVAWSSSSVCEEKNLGWVKFGIEKSELGWRTLEFLSWVLDDMRTAGERLLFMPTAPPPHLNEPGNCLSFVLEVFPKDGDQKVRFPKVASHISEYRNEYWKECAP